MRQFDLVRLENGTLALILQADLLRSTNTCVIAPLVPADAVLPTEKLHPRVSVREQDFVVAIEKLAAVHRRELKQVVASACDREWDIRRALDIVFVGV